MISAKKKLQIYSPWMFELELRPERDLHSNNEQILLKINSLTPLIIISTAAAMRTNERTNERSFFQ